MVLTKDWECCEVKREGKKERRREEKTEAWEERRKVRKGDG